MIKIMKSPDPGQPQQQQEGEGVPGALDFSADGDGRVSAGESLDGLQMVSVDAQADLRRKSRIVVCKNCGGNHYKKTACRAPSQNVEV